MTDRYHLGEIVTILDGELIGHVSLDSIVDGISTLIEAGPNDLCYYGNTRYAAYLTSTNALAVIVDQPCDTSAQSQIIVGNAYEGFRKVLGLFAPNRSSGFTGVHPSAVVHPDAVLGDNVSLGPTVVVDRDCVIAANTSIGAGCVLGPCVKLGEGCTIHPNVTLLAETEVGSHTVIHSGTVVGSDGFGFVPSATGEHRKVPQNGNVVIGNHVEIGSNCSIDRAVTGSTTIGDHTKLDNMIQVAHNVKIGKGCLIAAQTGIAGSTVVGNGVVFGGQVGVGGHIVVHDGAVVAAKSGVTKSVPAGLTVSGNPCRPHGENLRIGAAASRLPAIIARLEDMTAPEKEETED